MLVEVKVVERLIVHYSWVLDDVTAARKRVVGYGFSVKEERRLCQEVRLWLDQVKAMGKEVF